MLLPSCHSQFLSFQFVSSQLVQKWPGIPMRVADVPDSVLRQVAEAAGYDVVPQELNDYDRGTLRVRHMALVRSWMGVSAFDREALRIIVKASVEASRVREDLADIINVAIEELLRKRFELPGFTTSFPAARTARATGNRSLYDRVSQALNPPTKTGAYLLSSVPTAVTARGSITRPLDHWAFRPFRKLQAPTFTFIVHCRLRRKAHLLLNESM
jgi:hypothetical protein